VCPPICCLQLQWDITCHWRSSVRTKKAGEDSSAFPWLCPCFSMEHSILSSCRDSFVDDPVYTFCYLHVVCKFKETQQILPGVKGMEQIRPVTPPLKDAFHLIHNKPFSRRKPVQTYKPCFIYCSYILTRLTGPNKPDSSFARLILLAMEFVTSTLTVFKPSLIQCVYVQNIWSPHFHTCIMTVNI